MFKVTVHDANHTTVKEFKDASDFIMLEMREIPAFEDNMQVDQLEIDGKVIEFTGSVMDLFNKYNS